MTRQLRRDRTGAAHIKAAPREARSELTSAEAITRPFG